MTTSTVMEMNLGENAGLKQNVNGGGGRRKSKGSELTQKKNKQPQRGMGIAQLEQLRLQERRKKMTESPSLHPLPLPSFNSAAPFTTSTCTAVPNGALLFRPTPAVPTPTPAMLFQGIGIHGQNVFSTDHHIMDPSVIGSSIAGFRFENSKELSSIPNYIKCASDGCGVCHKKKRINGGSNACSVNQFRNFCGNNSVVKMIDAGRSRRGAGQVTEVMSVHRNGGSALTEYEFFPGGGGGGEELMRMGTVTRRTTSTWCGIGSGTSVGGMTGLRGGEGSCVTAITGSEEASGSSLDLSLKLSY